ncbi:MAG: hypothetical protein WBP38_05300 [Hyphomicrobium sp.]|jgi:hypothetical protein|nr:hypothetical protein [Hyphomicrobium sp.]
MLATVVQKTIAPNQPLSWFEAFLVSSAVFVAALPVTAGLYLVKSAMGINLMAGPSPLHNLLYHFVV